MLCPPCALEMKAHTAVRKRCLYSKEERVTVSVSKPAEPHQNSWTGRLQQGKWHQFLLYLKSALQVGILGDFSLCLASPRYWLKVATTAVWTMFPISVASLRQLPFPQEGKPWFKTSQRSFTELWANVAPDRMESQHRSS